MDVYDAIYSRRTIRDFQDKEIEMNIIKKIINAGLQAPSNDHMRQWEFVIVNDKSTRLKVIDKVNKKFTENDVAEILDRWGCTDPYQREMYFDGIPKQYRMLLNAGCLIIPYFRQKRPLLKPKNLSALNPFASIWCCIENILLAAVAEGIYGVTRIPFDKEIAHIKEIMKIPAEYEMPCYLALGYPQENLKPIKQLSIRVEERMHFNTW
jgi:nitroreductase